MAEPSRPPPDDHVFDDSMARFVQAGRELINVLEDIVGHDDPELLTSLVKTPAASSSTLAAVTEEAGAPELSREVSTQVGTSPAPQGASPCGLMGSEGGGHFESTPQQAIGSTGRLLGAPDAARSETEPALSTEQDTGLSAAGLLAPDPDGAQAGEDEGVSAARMRPDAPADRRPAVPAGYSELYRRKLDVLRSLLERRDAVLTPVPAPFAALGHAVPEVDERLGVAPGEGLNVLEDLADLGLLERELHNRIHVCPKCRRCQLNMREACPVCSSIDLDIERLIHHFHCAYSGLESEFENDLDLTCPKCRKPLRQLGQDFERPHETYVCRTAGHLFEQPYVEGQCLHCEHQFPGHELDVVRIYSYRPTLLTVRAVELGRLTGLDVTEIMFDADLQLATRGFLEIEIRRELLRVARHGGSFATAVLSFEANGRSYPVFREWPADTVRQMATVLASCFRTLDLVSKLDHAQLAVLLIETDQDVRVGERALEALGELVFRTRTGVELRPVWRSRAWSAPKTSFEDVLAFYETGSDGGDA